MQTTSHSSHTSHSKGCLTPGIIGAITIPILQQPIVTDQESYLGESLLFARFGLQYQLVFEVPVKQ